MQKISGILPGSSRVTSVDLKSSRPVRPGVPGFGAPQGESNLRDQVTRSQLTMQDPNSIEVPRWRSKEDTNAEIARSLSDQFFRRRVEQPEVEISDSVTMAEATPEGVSGLDMMDVLVNDITNDNRDTYRGFSQDLSEAGDNSRTGNLVADKQENINSAAKKGLATYQAEGEDTEGAALDTVA